VALAALSFHESFDVEKGGLDMDSPGAAEQLVNGWFELERNEQHAFRWGGGEAAAVVDLPRPATSMEMTYAMPPGRTAGLRVAIMPLQEDRELFSVELPYDDAAWRVERLPLSLAAGAYVVCFRAVQTWSNADGRDREGPRENRSLGFALARLSFEDGR
jgi:hypothetical protein